MSEPKYDEDLVNLGYLKKAVSDTEDNINKEYENVSRHYGSRPQPPYNKGDTWIDGDIVYVCIKSRQIGTYEDSDWVTESGAKKEAEKKNKVFLRQPSNYSPGDMWILQSDNDHKAGKKGEMLISTAGRAEYDEGDWINMLGYGSIRSINEVADNLNKAIDRIGDVEEAIEDGIIITFYQDSEPEGKHIGDLWYVTGEVEGYTKGKIYRYDGTTWILLDDPAIQKAFDEANEARIVADGKIQSFYSDTEPTKNMGVGDLWIDLDNNNQLYRYNGTKWVAVYDTRINELVVNVESVTERVTTVETDLGEIDLKVKEATTKITTIEGDVNNITNTTSPAEGKNIHLTDSAEEPLVDISLHGETKQATRSGKNLYSSITNHSSNVTANNLDLTFDFSVNQDTYARLNFKKEVGKIYTLVFDGSGMGVNESVEFYLDDKNKLFNFKNGKNVWVQTAINDNGRFTIDDATRTNISSAITMSNIMILEGEYTEATIPKYEPYGASPTPEFPSEIENVEGKNKLNLIDTAEAIIPSNEITYSISNQRLTINGTGLSSKYPWIVITKNGIYSKNGTPTASNITTWANGNIAKGIFKPSKKILSGSSTSNFSISLYDETGKNVTSSLTNDTNIVAVGIYLGEAQTFTNCVLGVQLEKGTEATEYIPYNSLAVKVTGKNLARINEGDINSYRLIHGIPVEKGEKITVIFKGTDTHNTSISGYVYLDETLDGSTGTYLKSISTNNTETLTIFTMPNSGYFSIACSYSYQSVTVEKLFVGKGEYTLEDYEEYKEQTAYFPLAEGQKLMEESYLADDGVHNKRTQIILNGTENIVDYGNNLAYYIDNISPKGYTNPSKDNESSGIGLCSHLSWNFGSKDTPNGIRFQHNNGSRLYILLENTNVTELKQWLSNNPITVEYELAEPKIIPYTAEQQEAWNKIRALTTYKNVTNISSDAYAKIVYMRDNGLDVYETKQNADKRYIETTEKFAEQKITVDGVKTQVSETEKRLTNDYLTAEQVNAEIGGTKEDIDILKQKQASTELTTEEFKIQFDKINNEGVSKVKTSMGYTFNDEGMHVNKDGAETGTIVDEAGVSVLDKTGSQDSKLLYAGYVKEGDTDFPGYVGQTIVASANMIVQKYLVVGTNSRFEDYVNPELGGKGTGAFEI